MRAVVIFVKTPLTINYISGFNTHELVKLM